MENNTDQNQKYIIVTIGATGSGKTKLVDEVIRQLNSGEKCNEDENCKKHIVDDLIMKDDTFNDGLKCTIKTIKEELDEVKCDQCDINNINNECEKELTQCKFKAIEKHNPTFENAYWNTRKKKGCRDSNSNNATKTCDTDKNVIYCNCDDKNDSQLQDSIIKGIKYIVIEGTGAKLPAEWFFNMLPKSGNNPKYNYNIIFAYSFVKYDDLILRNKSRVINDINNYEGAKNNPVPRLPLLSTVKGILIDSIKVLKSFYASRWKTAIFNYMDGNTAKTEYKFPEEYPIRVMIFDNNVKSNEDMKLLYDNRKNEVLDNEFNKMITDISGITEEELNVINNGGKNRNKKSKKLRKGKKRRNTRKKTKKLI